MSPNETTNPKRCILVVDDSDAGRYVTSRILAGAGFEVTEAATGTDALKRAAQRPDLILLDVNLPDLSGFEVCRRIKADPSTASIPVVHLTATSVHSTHRVQGLEGGADGYLVQPVEATELVATIRAFLRLRASEAALRESEVRFRVTFEQAAVGIAHVAPDGRWLRVNQKLCDITGYSREELLACRFQDITHPDDLDRDLEQVQKLLAAEIPAYSLEKRYLRRSGELLWVRITVALVRNDAGDPDYFISVLETIDARKRAEEELQSRTAELALHDRILLLLSQDTPLLEVLDEMARAVDALHPGMLTSILLVDEDGQHLRHGAAPGLPDAHNQAIDGLEIGDGVGACGTAAWRGERVISENVQEDPYWIPFRDLTRQAGVESCWSQPIKDSRNRVLGTFAIYHRQRRRPSDAEILLIESYANLAALAIGHRQVEAETVRQLDELRRWQSLMLDRADRSMELKREVNALLRRLGEPIRYPSQDDPAAGET